MDKTQRPGPNDSWLQNPPVVFDESFVEEVPVSQSQQQLPVNWHDVERARLIELQRLQRQRQQVAQGVTPSLGTYVDLLLLKLCGREPISTLVMTFAGCVVGAIQEDPTNWRGWLHGAVFALAGRMMNEFRDRG